jgi:hypothetical protein
VPDLDAITLVLDGERVALPLPITPPVRRGTLDVGLSTARGGPVVHPTLGRVVSVTDGVVGPCSLFAKDIRALFPRGGRLWLVVRYAGQLLGTGAVQLLVP